MSLVRKVAVENLQNKVPVNKKRIRNVVLAALKYLKIGKPAELNIYFVSDEKIKELNRSYLGKNCATDVISFDISTNKSHPCAQEGGKKELLADIVISADTAVSNAHRFRTSADYEFCLYAVHGLLHLLGFDDTTKSKQLKMHRKETEIMGKFFTGHQSLTTNY